MPSWPDRARLFVEEQLWNEAPLSPAPLAWLRNLAQLSIVIGRGFVNDELLLRAYGLTYLTLLSLIPGLALAVSILDLVGGSREALTGVLDEFTAATPAARQWLLERIQTFRFGTLGVVGGITLFATTVLAIGGVEQALNVIWGVKHRRSWMRRIPDYLAVVVVAPLLVGLAVPLAASLESQWVVQRLLELPGFGTLYAMLLRAAPGALVIGAFFFLYWFLPNTRVHPPAALLGATVGGVLFGLSQWAHMAFSIGATRQNAVFGALATIALFMTFVYVSWAIVLFGAEVAYAAQTLAHYRREVREPPAGGAEREAVGLAVALACARSFRDGHGPVSAEWLSDALDVPPRTVRDVVAELEGAGILRAAGDDGLATGLGRPAESVSLAQVLEALRGPRHAHVAEVEVMQAATGALADLDAASAGVAEARTLADLLGGLPAVDPAQAAS